MKGPILSPNARKDPFMTPGAMKGPILALNVSMGPFMTKGGGYAVPRTPSKRRGMARGLPAWSSGGSSSSGQLW